MAETLCQRLQKKATHAREQQKESMAYAAQIHVEKMILPILYAAADRGEPRASFAVHCSMTDAVVKCLVQPPYSVSEINMQVFPDIDDDTDTQPITITWVG